MDVAIVGGGLSGLGLLERLLAAGVDAQLFEARDRFGGRILTERLGGAPLDLGPSWFWPGQPHIAALLERLGLHAFEQHATGDLIVEDAVGTRRISGIAPMAGALRVRGGMGAIVDALVHGLPQERLHASVGVTSVCSDGTLGLADGTWRRAERIVLALPPRLAADLRLDPPLDPRLLHTMRAVPTWMAGHAKFVAAYSLPFWRERNLSGDAMSRRGPLMEIHDASPADGSRGALFGFVGIEPSARSGRGAEIERTAVAQLVRLFGEAAEEPIATRLVDWSDARETATEADQTSLAHHPRYGSLPVPGEPWSERLFFVGTEHASASGGLLEGALESVQAAFEQLLSECGAARHR